MQIGETGVLLEPAEAVVVAGVFGWCLTTRLGIGDPLSDIDVEMALRLTRATLELMKLPTTRSLPNFGALVDTFGETISGLEQILGTEPTLKVVK